MQDELMAAVKRLKSDWYRTYGDTGASFPAQFHTNIDGVIEAIDNPAHIPAVRELVEAARLVEYIHEINPANYDHDDVCELNTAVVELWALLRIVLEPFREKP